jgi:hypothetical protein
MFMENVEKIFFLEHQESINDGVNKFLNEMGSSVFYVVLKKEAH